jgi:uncharacterized protein YgbK (DUF1537 family)
MADQTELLSKEQGKLLIVADDFTGANDTGVQFSKLHLHTLVITGSEHLQESLRECDVLVVNTESRFDDQETAYRKAFMTGQLAAKEGISFFYKKIDSTMRGNIGSEIAGLMDSLELRHTFVVPALPKYGRTTVNGKVHINGVLLEETEFSLDPKNPVRESFIPKIISRQTNKRTAIIIHDYILAGKETVEEKLEHHLEAGVDIIIFDAREERDLELIASVISGVEGNVLFAGCSGLAEHLSKKLPIKKVRKTSVVIAGTVSDVTRQQIAFAARYLNTGIVDIDTGKIFSIDRTNEKKRILEIIADAVLRSEDLIIRSAPLRESVDSTFDTGEEYGMDRFRVSEAIALFLGELASEIIRNMPIKGILLTGGDTAIKTARCLNVYGLILDNEIVHGIPYGHFTGEEFKNTIIVSKAGGFGDEDAIFRVLNFLRNS